MLIQARIVDFFELHSDLEAAHSQVVVLLDRNGVLGEVKIEVHLRHEISFPSQEPSLRFVLKEIQQFGSTNHSV